MWNVFYERMLSTKRDEEHAKLSPDAWLFFNEFIFKGIIGILLAFAFILFFYSIIAGIFGLVFFFGGVQVVRYLGGYRYFAFPVLYALIGAIGSIFYFIEFMKSL